MAHVAKFHGRLRLIRNKVLRESKFFVLKLIEIIILRVYYTIPICVFLHFLDIPFQLLKLLSMV